MNFRYGEIYDIEIVYGIKKERIETIKGRYVGARGGRYTFLFCNGDGKLSVISSKGWNFAPNSSGARVRRNRSEMREAFQDEEKYYSSHDLDSGLRSVEGKS
ncbi:hypothetical protein COU59_01070 [Candidatus Pacearchaeota archaeon CG10_big_fil_rev_8_21_14_0_10_34_12]|nr:MAG: hypothetical protein COU59_01070 [Candidatus Pacearchaeota archaeon CG10_big_fil_rev_8_21_14_0_10_34_12]